MLHLHVFALSNKRPVDMADFSVGEKIFNEILEYPLPKKAGTRDYVFYMVPASDPFGAHGRKFFNAYFPNHKSFNLKAKMMQKAWKILSASCSMK